MPTRNPFQKFDLTGRTALVTGGGTGLGLHITMALAEAGARVIIVGRRLTALEEGAELVREALGDADIVCRSLDLADRQSVRDATDEFRTDYKGVDIFVGNAALPPERRPTQWADDIESDTLDRLIRVNLAANLELTTLLLPHMRQQKWGRVIYSSSSGGLMGDPNGGLSVYGATKGGLSGFTRHVATEMGPYGITVNAIAWGLFMTDMVQNNIDVMTPGEAQALISGYGSMTAAGRIGRPEEIEGLIQFLASNAGSYMNGATISLDGGMHITMRPNVAVANGALEGQVPAGAEGKSE